MLVAEGDSQVGGIGEKLGNHALDEVPLLLRAGHGQNNIYGPTSDVGTLLGNHDARADDCGLLRTQRFFSGNVMQAI
jgi:hypothetical protein